MALELAPLKTAYHAKHRGRGVYGVAGPDGTWIEADVKFSKAGAEHLVAELNAYGPGIMEETYRAALDAAKRMSEEAA